MEQLARSTRQIGVIIQRARKKQGWTQAALAERCGMRQATISGIEAGEKPAGIDTLLRILAALELEFRIAPRTRSRVEDLDDLF